MGIQTLSLFSGAPSSAEQAVDIRAHHGAGVIETKDWIKSDLLYFALPSG